MKRALTAIVSIFPGSRLKNVLLNGLGHDVAMTASIGPIVVVGRTTIVAGEHSRIGPFNTFRNVTKLTVGPYAEIGQWNWISAAPFLVECSSSSNAGEFFMGQHSSFTSRHYVDASGGVDIAEFATVAGARSVFMSHGIDVADNVLDTAPILVGRYSMVGGGCNLVMGAVVPDYSVVAMGSVVIRGLERTHALYAGAPAQYKKNVPEGAYAKRTKGAVPPRPRVSDGV